MMLIVNFSKQCIIEVQKRKCNMIIGRTKKQPNNIIIIKQRKSNIEREFEIMLRNLQSSINVTDSVIISLNIDQEKERDLNLICNSNIKVERFWKYYGIMLLKIENHIISIRM